MSNEFKSLVYPLYCFSLVEVPVRRSDRLLHSLCARRRRDRRRDSSSGDSSTNEEPSRSRKINKAKHSRHSAANNASSEGLKSGPVGPETLDKKVFIILYFS